MTIEHKCRVLMAASEINPNDYFIGYNRFHNIWVAQFKPTHDELSGIRFCPYCGEKLTKGDAE